MAFEYLAVPRGDKAVYDLAESYFTERLTAHYRPIGYACYREYEYAGASKLMPMVPTVSHTDPQKALILKMLQGGEDAPGFTFRKPKRIAGGLKERGFQKPDFLAFRAGDGVVGEIGTANMRSNKLAQLNSRLHDLNKLAEEEFDVHVQKSVGQPLRWHGMTWCAARYHPEEGPVVIPVDENRLISTAPTFEPTVPGLYLYQLLRYERHRLPIGNPVALPRLSPEMAGQLKEAWRRYQQTGQPSRSSIPSARQPGWLNAWPALRQALSNLAMALGIAVVVVTAVAVLVATLGLAAAGASVAIAGFAAMLESELRAPAQANPGFRLG